MPYSPLTCFLYAYGNTSKRDHARLRVIAEFIVDEYRAAGNAAGVAKFSALVTRHGAKE